MGYSSKLDDKLCYVYTQLVEHFLTKPYVHLEY